MLISDSHSERKMDVLLQTYGVRRETLMCVVSEKHKNEIAKRIGGDWESLATFIGVPNVDIEDIKVEHRKPLDRRLAMMRRWHELLGEEATYLRLVEGLRQIGRRDLIQNTLNDCKSWLSLSARKAILTGYCYRHSTWIIGSIMLGIFFSPIIVSKSMHNVIHYPHNITGIEQGNYFYPYLASFCVQTILFDHKKVINCSDSPESDLPVIHPLFVGRENDVHQVLRKVARAHIVNINGAPGFGKSTLAIHVGYEILKNGTSVRYINIEDKLFFAMNHVSKSKKKATPEGSSSATVPQEHKRFRSLTELSRSSLSESRSQSLTFNSQNENLFDELQRWSEAIKCNSVLILDNCDDILVSKFRQKFLRLIIALVKKSNFKLHIIIVSRERVLFLDSFDWWIVRELNQSASVQLLDNLAPAIDNESLRAVAELVEGCPLALKVIGQLLHLHGVRLIHKVKKELISVLDEVSNQEQRFRVIMDIAFNRLGVFKDCGYVLSLFPGSFDEIAGNIILVQKECLETYLKHSLLNEYSLAFNYRYKMHRLIKEYLQDKISTRENTTFITKFKTYFEELLLTNAIRQEIIDESDAQKYTLSLDLHNFHYLKELLLIESHLSSEELAVLAFLSDMKLIQPEQLHKYHIFYIQKVHDVCLLLNPKLCGQLYTNIVRYLYQQCRCETLKAYIQNFFNSPCMRYFQCEVVHYLQDLYLFSIVQLSQEELSYFDLVLVSHCKVRYKRWSVLRLLVTVFILCACMIISTSFPHNSATRYYYYTIKSMGYVAGVMLIIFFIHTMLIEPVLRFYKPIIEPAHHQVLRILEITTKSVCQCTVVFIVTMFIYTLSLISLKLLTKFTPSGITKYFITLAIFTVASISIGSFFLILQYYCCQFIPLCV